MLGKGLAGRAISKGSGEEGTGARSQQGTQDLWVSQGILRTQHSPAWWGVIPQLMWQR